MVQIPATQRAGDMHDGPDPDVLHAAPSAAAAEQVPFKTALHEPLAGHAAKLDGLRIEFAPQAPLAGASVNRMHRRPIVSHPTALATSHSSRAVHGSPTWPATGVMQVDWPAGQTVPALHAPPTQGSPARVTPAQTPQISSELRAQKALAH